MKKVLNYRKYFYLIGALFIGCLFFYITYKTPLAGDDWGYALNGMAQNPFKLAIDFYQSWSGRFFSELWGFIVAPNKVIWNIINPILFVICFIGIYRLAHVRKYFIAIPLMIMAIILSVDDNLRMETYTWLMGTTYVIPLALSFIYFMIIDHIIYKTTSIKGKSQIAMIGTNLILFYIGLTMENIAATMIVALVLLLIYAYFNRRELVKYLWINLAVSILAFVVMRLSPGSSARLLRDSADWAKLSIFEKLANGYPSFLEFTFINNNYLIFFLSFTMIYLLLCKHKKELILFKFASLIINILAIVSVFSFVFIKGQNELLNPSSLFSMIFWPIYTIDILLTLFFGLEGKRRDKAIFFFMLSGTANLVMMYSPIFGSRSSIYTVFYMIVVIVLVIESLDLASYAVIILVLLSLFVVIDRYNEYHYKYRLVALKQAERLETIKYYKDHPEVEEAWFEHFPIYTVHGADIEPGDTYHFETFKEYYQLPQDADKIFFAFKED